MRTVDAPEDFKMEEEGLVFVGDFYHHYGPAEEELAELDAHLKEFGLELVIFFLGTSDLAFKIEKRKGESND
jgi:hypothetical protein